MMFFFFFICFLIISTFSFLIWWCLFFILTLYFLFISNKKWSYSSILVYFSVQEFGGFLFILGFTKEISFLGLSLKLGVAPLYFWLGKVIFSLDQKSFVWLLTLQKLPYLFPFLTLLSSSFFFFFFIGLLFVYMSLFSAKTPLMMMNLSSVESLSWASFFMMCDSLSGLFFFSFYLFSFWAILNSFSMFMKGVFNPILCFWLMGMPFGVPFMLKFISFSEVLEGSAFFFLILSFLISLSIWSFSFFFVFNIKQESGSFLGFLLSFWILAGSLFFY